MYVKYISQSGSQTLKAHPTGLTKLIDTTGATSGSVSPLRVRENDMTKSAPAASKYLTDPGENSYRNMTSRSTYYTTYIIPAYYRYVQPYYKYTAPVYKYQSYTGFELYKRQYSYFSMYWINQFPWYIPLYKLNRSYTIDINYSLDINGEEAYIRIYSRNLTSMGYTYCILSIGDYTAYAKAYAWGNSSSASRTVEWNGTFAGETTLYRSYVSVPPYYSYTPPIYQYTAAKYYQPLLYRYQTV